MRNYRTAVLATLLAALIPSTAHAYTLGVTDDPASTAAFHATVYRVVIDPAKPLRFYDQLIAEHRAAGQEPQIAVGGTGTPSHASTAGLVDTAVAAARRWPYAYSISVVNEPNESGVGVCEYARTYLKAYQALHALGVKRILFGEWSPAPNAFAWHRAVLTRCKNTSPLLRPLVKHIAWHGYWDAINWGPKFRALHRQLGAVSPLLHVTEAGAILRCGRQIITSSREADLKGLRYWRKALRVVKRDRLTEIVVWGLHSPPETSVWDSGLIERGGRIRPGFWVIAHRS